MSHSIIGARPYSRSPQKPEHILQPPTKYQTLPSKSLTTTLTTHQTLTPFNPNLTECLIDSTKGIRYPLRQSFNKPNQILDINFVSVSTAAYRKPFQVDSQEAEKKQIRSISGSWNQHDENIIGRTDPHLMKENESLRNIVGNLQAQLKNYQSTREPDSHLTMKQHKIEELLAEKQEYLKQKTHQEQLFQDQERYVQDLERKSEDLLNSNNEITKLCQDLQTEVQTLKNEQREFQNKNIQIQSTLERFQTESSNQQQLQTDLELKLKQAYMKADMQSSQLDSMIEKLRSAQEQNQQLRIKCLESERTRDAAKREVMSINEAYQSLKLQIDQLRRDKEQIHSENEQLLLFNNKRKEEFESLFNDMENIQGELMRVTEQCNYLEQYNQQLEDNLRKYKNVTLVSHTQQQYKQFG